MSCQVLQSSFPFIDVNMCTCRNVVGGAARRWSGVFSESGLQWLDSLEFRQETMTAGVLGERTSLSGLVQSTSNAPSGGPRDRGAYYGSCLIGLVCYSQVSISTKRYPAPGRDLPDIGLRVRSRPWSGLAEWFRSDLMFWAVLWTFN